MFLSVILTTLDSLSNIFRKKALENIEISDTLMQFFGCAAPIFFSIIFALFGYIKLEHITIITIALAVVISVVEISRNYLLQDIYREEKISLVLPYENLNKILVIITGFLLFKEGNLISFILSLITIAIIVLFSIDYKNFSMPRNFFKIVLYQVLVALQYILVGYTLFSLTEFQLYFLFAIIGTAILFGSILFKKEYKNIKDIKKKEFMYIFLSTGTEEVELLISFFVISSVGVFMGIVLSLLEIVITIILAYFMLKETPSKKDITLGVIVSIMVVLIYYLGNIQL